MSVDSIAKEIGQSVYSTREILTAAQRSAIVKAGRDIVVRDFVPRIVDQIGRALEPDAPEIAVKRGDFALKMADRIGLTNADSVTTSSSDKEETFEEFIARRRVVKHGQPNSEPAPIHAEYRVVDTTTEGSLQAGDAPNDAGVDA